MRSSVLLFGAIASLAPAQSTPDITAMTTGPVSSLTPSLSSQIQQALLSYASSVQSSPEVTGIGIGLVFDGVPVNSAIADLNPVPTSQNVDWVSFANTPPSIPSEPTWFSSIGTDLRTSIIALQTSALNRAVNIVREQLGEPSTTIGGMATNTAGGAGATGTSDASPARMGASEGALGVAAIGLGLLAAAL